MPPRETNAEEREDTEALRILYQVLPPIEGERVSGVTRPCRTLYTTTRDLR